MATEGNQSAAKRARPNAAVNRGVSCPTCQMQTMRRVRRSGLLEKRIYPMFGYYPWECLSCGITKLFKDRGAKRSHQAS